jgi:hypothetical protein
MIFSLLLKAININCLRRGVDAFDKPIPRSGDRNLDIQQERMPPPRDGRTLSAVQFGGCQTHPEKDELLVPAGISEKNAREVMS